MSSNHCVSAMLVAYFIQVIMAPAVLLLIFESLLPCRCVNVLSRHTTTAVVINEYETRLLDDCRQVVRSGFAATAILCVLRQVCSHGARSALRLGLR